MSKVSRQNLPTPPGMFSTLGPSFILLGLALGSGELIMWPYLAANYGLGILWGGLLGITFQYVLNTETMRYTLAWGESVFVGFRKLSVVIPLWYIISTFIPWSLPGFSSASSQILSKYLNFPNSEAIIAVGLLLFTGLILSAGKFLYNTMEFLQRGVIMIGLPFTIILAAVLTNRTDWIEAAWGLVGRGDGWWFFPQGIAIASFLGAFAYSGAGGNLNLAQSYYIKEKGWGMGRFAAKISSLFSKDAQPTKIEGQIFKDTPANYRKWQGWWRMINFEHAMIFYLLGFITIAVMSVLAKSLVFGSDVGAGLSFLNAEAAIIASRTAPLIGTFFLLVAALMLFSTQMGILESSSRIISENVVLLFYKKGRKFNLSLGFYIALWTQILLGISIYISGFREPRFLLTLGAVLNAAAMTISFPLLFWLNKKKLPQTYQPGFVRKLIMLLAFIFFAGFVIVTARNFQI